MSAIEIRKVRTETDRDAVRAMVWEFFDLLHLRYPELATELRTYVEKQGIADQLANYERYFTPPAGESLLAFMDGAPVGIVKIRPRGEGGCEMNRMFVREAGRGQGIGRLLCVAVIEEARTLGYRTMFLDVLARHVEAIPLYRSVGFETWTDPEAHKKGVDIGINMRMDLDRGA